ncbi:MAG: DUF3566 domain-containing protein, partial [Candidatus Eisenbacteria bacterium]|nr:DUF3566 domain-containing protein [Candidatus Eisenbacteria bacterium]
RSSVLGCFASRKWTNPHEGGSVKHHVRRIGVLSAAKIAFFAYWALGIVMTVFYGGFFALLSLVDPGQIDRDFGEMSRVVGGLGALMVLLLGFLVSILYAVMGAAGTALGAVGYNVLARFLGGVELELDASPEDAIGGSGAGASGPTAPTAYAGAAQGDRGEVVWTEVKRPDAGSEGGAIPSRSVSDVAPGDAILGDDSGPTPPPAPPRPAMPDSRPGEADPDARWKPNS